MCCFSLMPVTIGRILVRNPSIVCRPVSFGMRGPSNVTSSAKDTLDRSFVAKQSKYTSTAATFCSRDGTPSPDFVLIETLASHFFAALIFAQRALWVAAIRLRAAADIFFRGLTPLLPETLPAFSARIFAQRALVASAIRAL